MPTPEETFRANYGPEGFLWLLSICSADYGFALMSPPAFELVCLAAPVGPGAGRSAAPVHAHGTVGYSDLRWLAFDLGQRTMVVHCREDVPVWVLRVAYRLGDPWVDVPLCEPPSSPAYTGPRPSLWDHLHD